MTFEDLYFYGLEYIRASLEEYSLGNRDAELMQSEEFRKYAKEQFFECTGSTSKEYADELVYLYHKWEENF